MEKSINANIDVMNNNNTNNNNKHSANDDEAKHCCSSKNCSENNANNSSSSGDRKERPFLSYSTFKKMSQDEEAEVAAATEIGNFQCNGIVGSSSSMPVTIHQQRHQHTICRLIKRFADGRVWIEMGGHELLLSSPKCNDDENFGKPEEAMNAWGNEPQHLPVSSIISNGIPASFINAAVGANNHHYQQQHHHHNHLTSCIFANNCKPSQASSPNSSRMRALTTMTAHPERMPFDDFCRQFRCLLVPPSAHKNGSEESGAAVEGDTRECARRILQHANVPEHRYRLGLSQILLQTETLVHLEEMRAARLAPIVTVFQTHCRHYLARKQLRTKQLHSDAVEVIQTSMEHWQKLNGWPWWKLFQQIRPLIPIASLDQKEQHWRDQLAQLESELDDMRTQLSCAQLELESTRKAKAMADEWGEQMQQKGEELRAGMETAHAKCEQMAEQLEAATTAASRARAGMETQIGWEQQEKTMDIKRELHEALDRAHCAEQKASKAMGQLNEVQSELDELRSKNERMEKRQKSSQEDLCILREQFDSLLEVKEQLERQVQELSIKELRKGKELRKEIEAKEVEMDAYRIKSQRQMRELESQLDQAKAEISTLNKQKLAFQQRGNGLLGSSASSICGESITDLAQSNFLLNTNRALKRKLSKALALLQNTQAQLASGINSVEKNTIIRTLRQQLEAAEVSELHARRAQLTAENELSQMKAQLSSAVSAKQTAEQKLTIATREKNAASTLARDHDEQLREALKRERCLVERLSLEQIQLRTQLEQICQLERELRSFKTGVRKSSADGTAFSSASLNANLVERQKLELAELKARDLGAELDLEMAQRRHAEALLNQAKDDLVVCQKQLQEASAAKDKEIGVHKQLKRENMALEQKLNEASRREADMATKHKALKLECIRLDEEQRSYAVDLKMANKRVEILQAAFNGGGGGTDSGSHHLGNAAIGIHSISSMSGGSDLDEMLLGEEEEEEREELMMMAATARRAESATLCRMERAVVAATAAAANNIVPMSPTTNNAAVTTRQRQASPEEEFDGANSDTAEGSSSSTGEQ